MVALHAAGFSGGEIWQVETLDVCMSARIKVEFDSKWI